MSLTPATRFNFDGVTPYADDQTADPDGVYHAHKIKQGSTVQVVFNFTGVTVADYTFAAEFKRGFGGQAVQATATFANTGANQITMTLTAADLASGDFEAADGVWDLEATLVSDTTVKDRWVEGIYQVTPEVTTT